MRFLRNCNSMVESLELLIMSVYLLFKFDVQVAETKTNQRRMVFEGRQSIPNVSVSCPAEILTSTNPFKQGVPLMSSHNSMTNSGGLHGM